MFNNQNLLGINGLGRIAKLTLWEHIRLKHFDGFVVNIGREVGTGLEAAAHTISRDSTYGSLQRFLYGYSENAFDIKIVDREKGLLEIDGMPVTILRSARNPEDINWRQYGVRLVIDCTGAHKDPTVLSGSGKPSVRGHLAAGAEKVIISAPTKIADKAAKMPDDCGMFIYGINHLDFDPQRHHVISAASCTTTGLSHMMKPLLENSETNKILTASMSTIHAATGTQSILDSSPKKGAGDLRKNRSIFNNIILTSTGAAKALEQVLPEIQQFGFMADSVRIPTNTASLIVLNVTFSSPMKESGQPVVNRDFLNGIYKEAAGGSQKGLLVFSEKQNVSADIIGFQASVVLEGHDTHTRTGFLDIPSEMLIQCGVKEAYDVRLPVTHAKIFGWYDNEYGSYVYSLGKLTVYIDKNM
ncbi:MAG: glyceraldehyde-3-phosphate dehydrogenase [Desulfobacteraceae bacterium 4572_87]|nr:MAG: glyceraldehyde-3-phosphate dehydrogenase [Desulfobacteraceae bacterium 4572_87]